MKKLKNLLQFWWLIFIPLVSLEKTLWENCSSFDIDIPGIGKTTFNQCTQLVENADCQLIAKFTLNQQPIFAQQIDLTGKQASICQPIPGLSTCQACFNIIDGVTNSSQKCATLNMNCGIIVSPAQSLGCFNASTIIQDLMNCQYKCPQDCSGNGYCDKGVCVCNTGYYGSSCNISIPTYGQCIFLPIGGSNQQLCGEFQYIDCAVNFNIRLGPEIIYTKKFPLYQFMSIFESPYCFSISNCSMCLEWSNLEMSANQTGGCSQISVGCGSDGRSSYQLFCFQDTMIVDYCLGRCPNDCSFHGECKSAKCVCDPLYTGNDCSIRLDCPNNCTGHGYCDKGSCICQPSYQGTDCSIPIDLQPANLPSQQNDAFLWIILVVITLVVIASVIGAVVYFKFRDRRDRVGFMKLELQEDDEF